MNVRLQKYKKNRILGMNKYNAAVAAGYSETTAKGHTSDLEKRAKIADVLDRHGLTDHILALKHSQLLQAKKVVGYLHQYKGSDKGGIEKVSPDEVVSNEFLDVDDFGVQLKALELAYKLKDHLKDKSLEGLVDKSTHYHLTFTSPAPNQQEDPNRIKELTL